MTNTCGGMKRGRGRGEERWRGKEGGDEKREETERKEGFNGAMG